MFNKSQPFDPLSLAYRPENEEKKRKRFSVRFGRKTVRILLAVLVVGAVGTGGYLYVHNLTPKETPDMIAQKQADKQAQEAKKKADAMIATVNKQIPLPTNEEPILATVSDKNSLQNQDFFKGAQDGDRILLYPKNKKAYLYRPSTKKVLAVAPLKYTVGQTDPTASVAGTQIAATPDPNASPNPTIIPHGKILIQSQH